MEPLASYIHTLPGITGFQIGSHVHSISLFADDIILMLTNPATSLGAVQDTLHLFHTVSYHKVNTTKSYVLNLDIDHPLKQSYPCVWKEEGISYLGTTLTSSTKSLYKANYAPFLQGVHNSLSHISNFELSWSGRLVAFKMKVLPQLLYMFRALPIVVPDSFFKSLQTIVNKFVWQNQKACC